MSNIVKIGDVTLIHGEYVYYINNYRDFTVVTDPPYGIGFKYNSHKDDADSYEQLMQPLLPFNKIILQYPEEMMKYLCPLYGAPDDVYAWCYNSNTNRQFRLWGFWGVKPVWDNVQQPCKNPTDKRVKPTVRSYDWVSDIQQVKNISKEKTEHPCQLPFKLVSNVVQLSGKNKILDTFMGSGTTALACINNGKEFVGIEKDEKYFNIAVNRVKEAYAKI